MHQCKRNDVLRFLYLNIYSFLIICAGIITLVAPFYLITKWTLVIQVIIAIRLFMISGRLFSTWKNKKKEIDILKKRNQVEFRPDTFDVFMQAPCGRLLVRQVLQDLNISNEYKTLLKSQKPLLERLRNNCTPPKTVVYINEEFV
jgi:hypothetical protein